MTKQEDFLKQLRSVRSLVLDKLTEIDDAEFNRKVKSKRSFNTWFKRHFGVKILSTDLDIVFSVANNKRNKGKEPLTGLFVSIYLGYLISEEDKYYSLDFKEQDQLRIIEEKESSLELAKLRTDAEREAMLLNYLQTGAYQVITYTTENVKIVKFGNSIAAKIK